MTYLRRQIAVRSAVGLIASLPEATVFPYRLSDVLPKYVVKIGSGLYTSDSIQMNASDSFTVPLPAAYSSSDRLACLFRATGVVKAVIVDPSALGTSTFLIKGTTGSTKGDHKGLLSWQGRVTSITISIPAGSDDIIIDYFLWSIPDLTLAASWQQGMQSLGVIP